MVAKERHFFANPHYSPPRFRLPPKRSLARAGLGIVRQTGSCLFHVRVFSTLKGHLRRLYTSNRVVNHPLRWPAVRACCVTWCCVESLSAYELRSLSLSLSASILSRTSSRYAHVRRSVSLNAVFWRRTKVALRHMWPSPRLLPLRCWLFSGGGMEGICVRLGRQSLFSH